MEQSLSSKSLARDIVCLMEYLPVEREAGAETFCLPDVVEVYDARPAYAPEAIQDALAHSLPAACDQRPLPRILDAGAGTGMVTEGIIAGGADVEIIALDHSRAMAASFMRRIINVPMVVGDFNAMPFADGSFDVVIFGTALHWGDPACLPDELHRVLAPGGSVVSLGSTVRSGSEFREIIQSLPGQAFRDNPMTPGRDRINLGPNFTFEYFQEFRQDVRVTQDRFDRLVMSLDPFQTAPPELFDQAWDRMQDYARRAQIDTLIPVPFDTLVRIARVEK